MEKVIELLKLWKEYTEKGNALSFRDFGIWLVNKFSAEENKPKTKVNGFFTEDQWVNIQLSRLFVYLERYKSVWLKKGFEKLPLRSAEEFMFLMYLEREDGPKKFDFLKSDFLLATTMEKATFFDMFKRLMEMGLLEEKKDEEDKRSKRIYLTDEGQKVLNFARMEMSNVTDLLFGNLTLEDKKFLLEKFNYLTGFHQKIHQEESESDLHTIVEKYLDTQDDVS